MDAGAGVGVAAGGGTGAGATLVVVGATLEGSCNSFDGEPGLGGRDGCRGELFSPVEGRGAAKVDGVGSGRGPGLSTLAIELTSGVTTMVGGAGGAFTAAAALALAFSLLFRSTIFASSILLFFTKSLTSPGLGIIKNYL